MANKMRNGGDCKLYRNSGSYASPTWNLIDNVEDLSMPMSKGAGEFKTRGRKFILKRGAKIDAGVEFTLVVDKGDDDLSVLRDAFLNGTVLEFAIMDEAIATVGAEGLRLACEVLEFPIDQPLEDKQSVAVKLAPGISDNDPAWMITPP